MTERLKKNIFKGISTLILLCLIGWIGLLRDNSINIIYMSDMKYLPYMMVSLHSAIKNKSPESKYKVHIIGEKLDEEAIKSLKEMEQDNVKIEVYQSREQKLDEKHLGRFEDYKVSLQKLFIAEYVPHLKKALYIDADTLIQKDLTELYQTDITENYAAASKDGMMYQYPDYVSGIKMSGRDFYFNSGVMLLNLEKIRKDDIIRRARIYFNTHQDVFGDQDVLNSVFGKHVILISYRYNCNSVFFEEKDAKFLSEFYKEPVSEKTEDVYKQAVILHFAGHKPWTQWFKQPYLKELWYNYMREIPTKYQQEN